MQRQLVGCVDETATAQGGDVRWQVRNDDGEFGTEKERQVEHAGPGNGAVAAGEAAKGIVDYLGVWVAADVGGDQSPAIVNWLAVATDRVF